MSARISLRNIDDNGVAQRAHVYSIDGDLSLLISWKERMFPNSPEIETLGRTIDEGSSISQKFADLLLTTESLVLTANNLLYKCGLKPNMIVNKKTMVKSEIIERDGLYLYPMWVKQRKGQRPKDTNDIKSGAKYFPVGLLEGESSSKDPWDDFLF